MSLKDYAQVNNIEVAKETLGIADIVQESYKMSYRVKQSGNSGLLGLIESHLKSIQGNPLDTEGLSEDLAILQGLEKLGESAVLDEVIVKKAKKRTHLVDKDRSRAAKKSWRKNRSKIKKALSKFRKSSKGKSFYKSLGKFNAKMNDSKELDLKESIQLFKAANSALTHLAVELEHNPDFQDAFNESAEILAEDIRELLESIISNKTPDSTLLESFQDFHNILLESDEEDEEDDMDEDDLDGEEEEDLEDCKKK